MLNSNLRGELLVRKPGDGGNNAKTNPMLAVVVYTDVLVPFAINLFVLAKKKVKSPSVKRIKPFVKNSKVVFLKTSPGVKNIFFKYVQPRRSNQDKI